MREPKDPTISRTELIKAALKVKRLHDRWIELHTYGTGKPTPEQVKQAKKDFQEAESAFYLLPDKLTPIRRRKRKSPAHV